MTLAEFKEWKLNQQTIEFFQYLQDRREVLKEEWAQAQYVGEVGEETLQRNAAALGEAKLLAELVSLDYETFEGDKIEWKYLGD